MPSDLISQSACPAGKRSPRPQPRSEVSAWFQCRFCRAPVYAATPPARRKVGWVDPEICPGGRYTEYENCDAARVRRATERRLFMSKGRACLWTRWSIYAFLRGESSDGIV